MDASSSAYDVLGIEPGADPQAIERAYKKLIKRYHPDRKGGNAARAAEINRAYAELRRRQRQEPDRPASNDVAEAIYARRAARVRPQPQPRQQSYWGRVLFGALIVLGVMRAEDIAGAVPAIARSFTAAWKPVLDSAPIDGGPVSPSAIDEPLDQQAIQAGMAAVLRIGLRDEDQLAEWSRECHRRLRERPSASQLDRCAAFDDAVVTLARRDPLHDGGPFSASAVTARSMAGATLLTNDYLAIEGRLDQIRSRVEAALAPPPLEIVPAAP